MYHGEAKGKCGMNELQGCGDELKKECVEIAKIISCILKIEQWKPGL
jgi:hypothetical protein